MPMKPMGPMESVWPIGPMRPMRLIGPPVSWSELYNHVLWGSLGAKKKSSPDQWLAGVLCCTCCHCSGEGEPMGT
jgi:hypothetical protein